MEYKDKVEDVINGFKGQITGKAEYFDTNTTDYRVEALDKDGKPISRWISEGRLVLV